MEEKVEGIVLRSLPFQEKNRILTIFSKEMGLFSLFVKKITTSHLMMLTTPFCLGEFIYRKGSGELFSFKDGTVFESHSFLRNDFSSCSLASLMARAILDSQFPHHHVAQLYPLFLSYLKQLELFEIKENLVASFFLKILMHEGIFHLSDSCNICKKNASYLLRGESLCALHQEKGSLFFSEEEWKILHVLTYARSFRFLKEIELTEEMKRKISVIFQELSDSRLSMVPDR